MSQPLSTLWRLNNTGPNGSLAITDTGPLGLDVVINGGVTIQSNKLNFAAGGDFLQVYGGDFAGFVGSRDFSYTCTFATAQTSNYVALLTKPGTSGDSTPGSFVVLLNNGTNDGKIVLYSAELGAGVLLTSAGGFNDGAEHDFEFARKGLNVTFSVDGTLLATSADIPFGLISNASPIRIGYDAYHSERQFVGTMRNIRMRGPLYFPTSPAIQVAASDETTALTVGTKVTFRTTRPMDLIREVRASLSTAQVSGTLLTIDVQKNGVSIFSTLLTFDNTSKTTKGAATPAVLSTTSIADDDEISVLVTALGNGTAKGLKVAILGS